MKILVESNPLQHLHSMLKLRTSRPKLHKLTRENRNGGVWLSGFAV